MHPAAQRYFALSKPQQRQVQIILCEQALLVWNALCSDQIRYRESVTGSTQILDPNLPRQALLAVKIGANAAEIESDYLEPLSALHNEELELHPRAESAFYAIRNLFISTFFKREVDPWLVPNQALFAIDEENAISVLEGALETAAKLPPEQ